MAPAEALAYKHSTKRNLACTDTGQVYKTYLSTVRHIPEHLLNFKSRSNPQVQLFLCLKLNVFKGSAEWGPECSALRGLITAVREIFIGTSVFSLLAQF